ncbi:MAG TPA: HNH endonuclease [Planctomycetes bacterium]|nr:HNH endonuclease [Planctomycetota bacterium]
MKLVISRLANTDPKYPGVTGGWNRGYYLLYEYDQRTTVNHAWSTSKIDQEHTIEHIMPQSRGDPHWDREWPDESEFDRYKHRLGNLVLTRDLASNSHLGRKSIGDKINDLAGKSVHNIEFKPFVAPPCRTY